MAGAQELPEYAVLLRDFTNTVDEPNEVEALPNGPDLAQWLRHYGLLDASGPASAASEAELALALRLRTGLRMAMANHHDGVAAAVPELDEACRELPLRVGFRDTRPRLEPVAGGVLGALARLAVAVADAQADGGWGRLKLCRADDCRYAFFDGSKNRSKHWCSMRSCGNRQKTRAYRTRARELGASDGPA